MLKTGVHIPFTVTRSDGRHRELIKGYLDPGTRKTKTKPKPISLPQL